MKLLTLAIVVLPALIAAQNPHLKPCNLTVLSPPPSGVSCGTLQTPNEPRGSRNLITGAPARQPTRLRCAQACKDQTSCKSLTWSASTKKCNLYSATGARMGLHKSTDDTKFCKSSARPKHL